MKIPAPIFRLRRQAKLLSREARIPLNKALDRIAENEGFGSWSLLAAKTPKHRPAAALLASLNPGDMVLVAARPGHGKTMLSLGLLAEAINAGNKGVFFTLEYNRTEAVERLRAVGANQKADNLHIDSSDEIDADYIIGQLQSAQPNTVVVIDYLQLLDQRRESQKLSVQIAALKSFAEKSGVIFVFVSQIDRAFELSGKPFPEITDIRLPNALDLKLFSKACFLNDGAIQFGAVDTQLRTGCEG